MPGTGSKGMPRFLAECNNSKKRDARTIVRRLRVAGTGVSRKAGPSPESRENSGNAARYEWFNISGVFRDVSGASFG